ncbi:unnamed protein product [Paramecium sonneborni]|uniref:Uncharacterized protein n=1 Tax=Paramecium sonneborni TaxID=65129 RepID=A0A8S1NSL0_9CILI|nr:unnamed protein product [Paramecium sonneborni]
MGVSICQQSCSINNHGVTKQQLELLPLNLDSKCNKCQIQLVANQLKIKIQEATKICCILPDDPVSSSREQSSIYDRPEAQTPYLPYSNQESKQQSNQYIQLFGKDFTQSIKIQSQLVSSNNEDILQQFQQQQSGQSYPRFCNEENKQQIYSLQVVEDNLDDYLHFDWKNSKFQLISINEQNLLTKSNPTIPTKKQIRKQLQ